MADCKAHPYVRRAEVFDVSHNPELGGVIPEQIIVDWAEPWWRGICRPYPRHSRSTVSRSPHKCEEVDYLAVLNTTIAGYISSLCSGLRL